MIHWPSCRLAFGKPDISGVGFYERNYDGETFERNCRLSYLTYCLWSTGISIFDRIKGSLRSRIVIWRMQSAANIKSYLRQQRTFW